MWPSANAHEGRFGNIAILGKEVWIVQNSHIYIVDRDFVV